MTAADKLRELLATRPAMPNTEELVRWWGTGAELVRAVLHEHHPCHLAEIRRLDGLVAQLRAEREQLLVENEEVFEYGFWHPCSGCHELNEGHPTGPYSHALRCHLGSGCHECGGIGAVWELFHPVSWLDCEDCRALSKSGAEPGRCEALLAMESARG